MDNARVARVCGNSVGKAAGTMDRNFLLHYEYAEFTVQSRSSPFYLTPRQGHDHPPLPVDERWRCMLFGGQVRLSGRKSHLLYDVENRHTNDFFEDDISMVVADGQRSSKPLLRHLEAGAVRVTHIC